MWAYSFFFSPVYIYTYVCIWTFVYTCVYVCCRRLNNIDYLIERVAKVWFHKNLLLFGFLGLYCVYVLWPVRFPVGDSVLGSKHYVAHGTDTAYTFGAFSCMDYSGSAESWAPTADEKRLSQRITSAYLPPELLQLTFVSVKVPFVVHLRWERRKAFVAVRASVGPVRNNATASVAILDHRNP